MQQLLIDPRDRNTMPVIIEHTNRSLFLYEWLKPEGDTYTITYECNFQSRSGKVYSQTISKEQRDRILKLSYKSFIRTTISTTDILDRRLTLVGIHPIEKIIY